MKNASNIITETSVEILRQLKGQHVESISVEQTDTLEHTLSQMLILYLTNEDISSLPSSYGTAVDGVCKTSHG